MMDFFFDIDGTLLPFGKPAPESAVRTLHSLRRSGHRVFLATGRSPAEVPEDVYAIGFDGGVFSAGADVIADGRRIFYSPLSTDERDHLIGFCRERGFHLLVQTSEATYATKEGLEYWTEQVRIHTGTEIAIASIRQVKELPSDAVVMKVLYVTECYPLEKVASELDSRFAVVDNTVGLPSYMMGEIVRSGITKATGIDRMIEHYGDSLAETAAFGDGANDIEMIEHAGFGIAMGNASQELKDAADWVAPSVDEDGLMAGVAHVLEATGRPGLESRY